MNPELQAMFEKEAIDCGFINDRDLFNKDRKGIYLDATVFFMYRIWVRKQSEIEKMKEGYSRRIEESFICGYTEAEYDFKKHGSQQK